MGLVLGNILITDDTRLSSVDISLLISAHLLSRIAPRHSGLRSVRWARRSSGVLAF